VRSLKKWLGTPILVLVLTGCTIFGVPVCGNGKLNLSHARLDATSFTCPTRVTDYSYRIDGSLDADNETRMKITVKSMSTTAVVDRLAGNWGMAVGDTSSAEHLDFSPPAIDSGQKTTFKFTTRWSCSNAGENTQETYADFKVKLIIETDSGRYTVDLPEHRMKMA
jgi:hypothetical protein